MRHARSRAGTRITWLSFVLFSPRVVDCVRLSTTSNGFLSASVLATSCPPLRSPFTTAGLIAATPATGVGLSGPLRKYLHRSPALAQTNHPAPASKPNLCPHLA